MAPHPPPRCMTARPSRPALPRPRIPGGPRPGVAHRSPPAQAPASGGVCFLRLGARGHPAGGPAGECAPSCPSEPGDTAPTTRVSGHRGAPGGVPSSAFSGSRDASSAHSSSPQGARQGPQRPNRFTRSFPAPGDATPTLVPGFGRRREARAEDEDSNTRGLNAKQEEGLRRELAREIVEGSLCPHPGPQCRCMAGSVGSLPALSPTPGSV